MISERRQFRILYRDFLFRMVDLEVLTAHGEIQKLLGQLAALLAAFSFTLAVVCAPRYVKSTLPWQKLLVAAWGDEEFLIATTIAVVGILAVIAWNTVLPDRRDCLVLGPLPVRVRTMFAARITAMATALGASVVAVNIFTGLTFAFLLIRPDGNPVRSFAAYWGSMLAAGVFVFSALLAVQGVTALFLSYRLFLRCSSFLQIIMFFAILGGYFLRPQIATVTGLTDPSNQRLIAWLPPLWFLGLFQELNHPTHPIFGGLSVIAIRNLSIVLAISLPAYTLAYVRHARRIVEQADIAPSDRGRISLRFGRFIAARLLDKPLDRAILLFTARTVARSRQHRLLLSAYCGAGLAIALAYTKSQIYGYSHTPWYRLNQEFLAASLVVLVFTIVGTRAVFSLPMALTANWIFRIAQVHSPLEYFVAVRRALYMLTAIPIFLVLTATLCLIWPAGAAGQHSIVLALVCVLVVEIAMHRFLKIPFACSYLPGNANMNTRLGIYLVILMVIAEVGTQLELWCLQKPARFLFLAAALFAAAAMARQRTEQNVSSPDGRIQFEEAPPQEVFVIDLH